jgi:hypothetical protein
MATMSTPTNQREEVVQNKPQDMGDKVKQFGEKAKDAAAGVVDKTKDLAGNVADRARNVAGNVADKTRETASALGHKAEDATRAVGQGMEALADSVRHNLPQGGAIGSAATSVASGLENSGRYIEQQGLQGIGEDLLNLARRNPISALFLGVGLGYILARVTSPRS